MIYYFQKWWELPTYDGFKYHVNVTDDLDCFQRRGSRLGRRRLGQALPINRMINSSIIMERIKQVSSWSLHVGRLMTISTNDRSSQPSIKSSKTLLQDYGKIHLLISTLILITACLFMSSSRRLRHMLIR